MRECGGFAVEPGSADATTCRAAKSPSHVLESLVRGLAPEMRCSLSSNFRGQSTKRRAIVLRVRSTHTDFLVASLRYNLIFSGINL